MLACINLLSNISIFIIFTFVHLACRDKSQGTLSRFWVLKCDDKWIGQLYWCGPVPNRCICSWSIQFCLIHNCNPWALSITDTSCNSYPHSILNTSSFDTEFILIWSLFCSHSVLLPILFPSFHKDYIVKLLFKWKPKVSLRILTSLYDVFTMPLRISNLPKWILSLSGAFIMAGPHPFKVTWKAWLMN